MSRKSKALPDRVGAEDTLRLQLALKELEVLRLQAQRAIEEAAKAVDSLRDSIWKKHGLAAEDSVDLRDGSIKRGA
jgi:predicted DNA-binding protein (UPF0251 family)